MHAGKWSHRQMCIHPESHKYHEHKFKHNISKHCAVKKQRPNSADIMNTVNVEMEKHSSFLTSRYNLCWWYSDFIENLSVCYNSASFSKTAKMRIYVSRSWCVCTWAHYYYYYYFFFLVPCWWSKDLGSKPVMPGQVIVTTSRKTSQKVSELSEKKKKVEK